MVDVYGKVEGVGEVDGLHHWLHHTVPDVEQGDRVVKPQIPEQSGKVWLARSGSVSLQAHPQTQGPARGVTHVYLWMRVPI